MDASPALQAISELLPYLESLDTKNTAILQALKERGLLTDEEFAPYLEQAANMTSVRWLAARVRIERLLSTKVQDSEKPPESNRGPENDKAAEEDKKAEPKTAKEEGSESPSGERAEQDKQEQEMDARKENKGQEDAPETEDNGKKQAGDGVNRQSMKNAGAKRK